MRKHKYEVWKVISKQRFLEGVYVTKKLARRRKREIKKEYPFTVEIKKSKNEI